MSNYNLIIQNLVFDFDTSQFSLEITVQGNQFPKPDNLSGNLNGNNITFDMSSRTSDLVNQANFTFGTSTILTSYNFSFTNIPGNTGEDEMSGAIESMASEANTFSVESCTILASTGVEDGDTATKGGTLKVRKKPSDNTCYNCTGIALNISKTAVVMSFVVADEDNLSATYNNVPSSLFTSGMNINTIVTDSNPMPDTISAVSMTD